MTYRPGLEAAMKTQVAAQQEALAAAQAQIASLDTTQAALAAQVTALTAQLATLGAGTGGAGGSGGGTTPPADVLALAAPVGVQAGGSYAVAGTYSAGTAPTLTVSIDGAAGVALPAGSTVQAGVIALHMPGLAAGSHTLSVSDGTNTSNTITFTVAAAAQPEALTVSAPSTMTVGTAATITGTYGNATLSAGIDYLLPGGAWTAASGATIATGQISFSVTPTAAGSGPVQIRDHANQGVTASSATVTISAAATGPAPVLSFTAPTSMTVGTAATITGSVTGGTATQVDYELPGASYVTVPITLDGSGNFSLPVTPTAAGSGTILLRLTATPSVVATSGAAVTVAAPDGAPVSVGPNLTPSGTTTFETGVYAGTQALGNGGGTAAVPISGASFAAGVWLSQATPPGEGYPLDFEVYGDAGMTVSRTGLVIGGGGNVEINYGGTYGPTSSQSVCNGTPHFLSYAYFAATGIVQQYIDGVCIASETASNMPSGTLYAIITATEVYGNALQVYDAVIYNGTGPMTQVAVGATSFTPPNGLIPDNTPNLAALWHLDGGLNSGTPSNPAGGGSGGSSGPATTTGTSAPASSGGGSSGGSSGSTQSAGTVSSTPAASARSITYSGPIIRGTGTTPPAYTVPNAINVTHQPAGTDAAYISQSMPGFARGWLAPTQKLMWTPSGGSPVECQVDEGARWLNGSHRTAIVTYPQAVTNGTNVAGTLSVGTGTRNTTPFITPAQIIQQLATNDFQIRTAGQDGRHYVTSLHDIMTAYAEGPAAAAYQPGQWELWQSGPYKVSIRAWQYLKDSTSGAFHKFRLDTIYAEFRYDGKWDFSGASEQSNYVGAFKGGTINSDGTTSTAAPGPNNPQGGQNGDYQGKFVGAVELWHGNTLVLAQGGPNDVRTATMAASALFAGASVALPSGYTTMSIVSFAPASGGTLPTGITAGTPYWVGYDGSTTTLSPYPGGVPYLQNGTRNTVTWGTNASGGVAGSGNIVVTPLVATYAGTRATYAGQNGLPVPVDYTPAPVLIEYDEAYMSKGARLWPVFDPSMSRYGSAQMGYSPLAWFPNQRPWGSWINETGDNPGDNRIGYVNQTSAQALLLPLDQTLVTNALVQGLGWADEPFWWRDTASGRVFVHDNGPDDNGSLYPGLGSNYPSAGLGNYDDHTWIGLATYSGSVDWSGYTDGYDSSAFDPSHQPCPWAVPAFLTGRAIFFDQGWAHAGAACLMNGYMTSQAVGSKTFYNVFFYAQQPRGSGWAIRSVSFAEAFTPSNLPEAAYVRHMMDSSAAWAGAYAKSNPPEAVLGILKPCESATNGVQQYQNDIKFISIGMEAIRGERQGWCDYLTVAANFFAGIANDASSTGGSGAFVNDGYYMSPYLSDNSTPAYSNLRDLIANTSNYQYATPPYPSTGFYSSPNAVKGNPPTEDTTFNNVTAYQATSYAVIHRAALIMAYTAGIKSVNNDDCGAVLQLLNTRFTTAPCMSTSPMFSSTNWQSSSYPGAQWFPAFAFAPE